MTSELSLTISIIALFISGLTFYYSRMKTGRVKMTKPTTIFFGPDGKNMEHLYHSKVFIRTLLYSTSDKGQYIQNMYARLTRGESIQNFNVWVYGDNELLRGSGLFIDKAGISSNHHFLLPKDGTHYKFLSGEYNLQIFVETVDNASYKIFEQNLPLTVTLHKDMIDNRSSIYYDWEPNSKTYHPHLASILPKPKYLS